MKTMKWMGLCSAVLLAASLMWTTGCGGSDGDDGTTIVVTNGTTVVTNAAAPQALVAPQLITPANGASYSMVFIPVAGHEVDFEWTAVPGAASYVLELDGVQTAVAGTTTTLPESFGNHKWRVWAKDAAGSSGPASGKFSFDIIALPFIPLNP